MTKTKKIIDAKDKETKEITHEEQIIEDFVNHHEMNAGLEDDHYSLPVTIRVSNNSVAILDHLVKRWRSTRSHLAAQLLEEMIWLVFLKVYKGTPRDEFVLLKRKIHEEFEEKRNKTKSGKVKKGDK